jgi:hypothetical protein
VFKSRLDIVMVTGIYPPVPLTGWIENELPSVVKHLLGANVQLGFIFGKRWQ